MRSTRMIALLIVMAPLILSFNFFKSKSRNHADIAREVRTQTGKKLAKKHQMDVIGVGGGMMGSVYMIGLHFQIHHPMNRDEARARIVDCVEELLKDVNENEEIRPFLKDYPFTTKNVQISIYSNDSKGQEALDPYISVVSVYVSDNIYFSTVDRPNSSSYKHRYQESYSEALTSLRRKCIQPEFTRS